MKRRLANLFGASLVTLMGFGVSAQAELNVHAQSSERAMERALFFARGPDGFALPCQYAIHYGQPTWNESYDGEFQNSPIGRRFRLGNDFWTTLDTNRPLAFGEVKVPAGYYYICLQKVAADKVALVLLDPAPIREKQQDAYHSDKITGGILLPMNWEKSEKESDSKLLFKITPDLKSTKQAKLSVAFGPHRLTATFSAEF